MVNCATVFVAVVSVVLSGLVVPAKAAWTDNGLALGDYLSHWDFDSTGTKKQLYFDFTPLAKSGKAYVWIDDLPVSVYPMPSGSVTASIESDILWRYFILGGEVAYQQPLYSAPTLPYFDVRDVTFGTGVNFMASWTLHITYSGAMLDWRATCGLYLYDSAGHMIDWVCTQRDYTLSSGGYYTVNLDGAIADNFGSDVAYVIPYFEFLVTSNIEDATNTILVKWADISYGLRVDLDLVAENSALQNAINDKLGELNDKADQIISGGEAGDNLNDAIGPSTPFGDASGNLGNAMGDFENSSSKLPSTPSKLPSSDSGIPTSPPPKKPSDVTGPAPTGPATPEDPTVANPDSVEDYVDIAGNFFDWDASGLTYMYAPMVLSVTLAILFYTVFGKA